MIHPGKELRQQIESGGSIEPFIGIYDAFSATIASQYSFNLFYSGFGFAASHYGLPNIGCTAWTDMVQAAWRIRQILPDHKLMVDLDGGYGDIHLMCHIVRQLENMGVAMIMLDDQVSPSAGLSNARDTLLPIDQYVEKLERLLSHRRETCVLARTDDSSGYEIFRRVEAISKTDADALLIDGVQSLETLREIRRVTNKPILFNQTAGGKGPRITLTKLRQAGVNLALYSTPCLFAAQTAIEDTLTQIFSDDGRLPETPRGAAVGISRLLQGNMNQWADKKLAS